MHIPFSQERAVPNALPNQGPPPHCIARASPTRNGRPIRVDRCICKREKDIYNKRVYTRQNFLRMGTHTQTHTHIYMHTYIPTKASLTTRNPKGINHPVCPPVAKRTGYTRPPLTPPSELTRPRKHMVRGKDLGKPGRSPSYRMHGYNRRNSLNAVKRTISCIVLAMSVCQRCCPGTVVVAQLT